MMRHRCPPARTSAIVASLLAALTVACSANAELAPPARLTDQTPSASSKPALPTLFSAEPTVAEFQQARVFEEALASTGSSAPGSGENRLLAAALLSVRRTRADTGSADLRLVEQFMDRFPNSTWAATLWTNLGLEYFKRGSFTKALDAWERAWKIGRNATEPVGVLVINRAVAELAKMHARLGHMSDLERIFAEVANRPMAGSPAETIAHSRDALSNMKTRPDVSFKCGPYALDGILAQRNPADPARAMLREVASTTDGTSLAFLVDVAARSQLSMQAVRRSGAREIPVPAVVHWKLGHYGALLRQEGDRYLLQDPTFGSTQWIRQEVIAEESSGYFLLAGQNAKLPDGWKAVLPAEAAGVWGKGNTAGSNPNGSGANNPTPPTPPNSCPENGMAVWTVHLMLTSLNLTDTPLSYRPPVGPAVSFSLNYDMREANQPATFSFSNFGNRWNFNGVSSLTFDTNNAYLRSGQGGTQVFTNFNSASTAYPVFSSRDVQTRSVVVRQAATVYQQQFPDGSMNVFALVDSSGRAYQTKYTDPQGHSLQYGYDAQFRLVTITDAIGQITILSYALGSDPLKVTKITDPFGRTAQFDYNGAGQLTRITDAVGLTSDFTYGVADQVQTLVTGYGTTSFAFTDSGANQRLLLVTLPDGSQEKFESSTAVGYPTSDPVVPLGMPTLNQYHEFRNTFHWDRKAMQEAPNDYTKATVYHFLHSTDIAMTGLLLESVKKPLENREWFFYQGQLNPGFMNDGMLERKTFIGRVLDDGTTRLIQNQFDAVGNLIQRTDPVGRTSLFIYDLNGIDLLAIRQFTSAATSAPISSYTYNGQHLPLTVTDAAGQTTINTYNGFGEILTVVNPKSETTTFSYDVNGYLLSVVGPLAPVGGQTSFTYDPVGRKKTRTDSLGFTVTFGYDNLDRLISVTYPDLTSESSIYTLLDVTKYTDRLNRETTCVYNSLRQAVSRTDALNLVTRYGYCRCGALSSLTDPLGRTTTWEYDLQSRKIAKIYADATRTTYLYEATTSRLQSVVDSRGQARFLEYNVDDTVKVMSYANATTFTPSVSFDYDTIYPRLKAMTDALGTTDYQYYPVGPGQVLGAGQLSARTNSLGSIQFTYDELGRGSSRTVNGAGESISYDGLGRAASLSNALGNFSYGYLNDSDLLASLAYPNGQTSTRSYFPNSGDHRLQQILHRRANGTVLSQWDYAYNAESQITSWTQQRDSGAARVVTPGYDATDQLTGATLTNPATSYAYAYDPAGNRVTETLNAVSTSASYNALNELLTISPPSTTDRTYEWDAENRLTAINYTGGSQRTEFAYDGIGRRIRITEKSGSTITGVKQFLWDDLRLAAELDSGGNVTKRFFSQGMQLLSGANAGVYFYAKDHLGSIRELTDASGALRARYDYDPFGRRTKSAGDLDADFGFTSLYVHPPSSLGLAQFRAYDPSVGRWLSRDPLGEIGGGDTNLFRYVSNRPLFDSDLSGLSGDTTLSTAKESIGRLILLVREKLRGQRILGFERLDVQIDLERQIEALEKPPKSCPPDDHALRVLKAKYKAAKELVKLANDKIANIEAEIELLDAVYARTP